ncbi:MAG: sulfatase-like hydrolase/transferase [Planctomycetes bacterium]|nr:sulfatase-like hydrolase/transferase [Planctomycetota bacterium]
MADNANQPNVLFIIPDQHHASCVGCYGNDRIQTPHMDRLAREGIRVDRAYVTNPLCTPARASILTGQSIGGHGAWNNGVPLAESVRTLGDALGERGYRTAALGKLHLSPQQPGCPEYPENADFWNTDPPPDWHGPYHGFQEVQLAVGHGNCIGHYGQYLHRIDPGLAEKYRRENALADTGAPHSWKSAMPVEYHSCTWIGDRTVEFLKSTGGQPFFAHCSFIFPHFPFAPPAPYCYQYDPADMVLPERRDGDLEGKPEHVMRYYRAPRTKPGTVALCDVTEEQMREVHAHTYGQVSLVDHQVGRILGALDEMGLAENTIVMLCADHGELLGDHGLLYKGPYHYEGLLRIPMIWRWPKGMAGGGATSGLFSQADIAPTVLDMLGLDPWPEVEGRSQAPALRGEARSVRDAVLIEYYHGRPRPEDDMRLKTIVTDRWKLTHYVGETFGELYDLANDPGEFVNLFDNPDYRQTRADLTEQLVDLISDSDVRFERRLAPA